MICSLAPANEVQAPPIAELEAPTAPLDTSELLMGRFTFKLIEARDLSKHDAASAIQATRLDPYVKITLGGHKKKALSKKSKVFKNSGRNVHMGHEALVFDVVTPADLVYDNQVTMTIGVYNSNLISDTLIAQTTISLLDYYRDFHHNVELPLQFDHKKNGRISAGSIHVDVRFQPAKLGYLVITCKEGRNMKNMELLGKQDPYCRVNLGSEKKRSRTIKNGGKNCSFGHEKLQFAIGARNWAEDLVFSCLDEDIGSDDLIGSTKFDLLSFMSTAQNAQDLSVEGKTEPLDQFFPIYQGKKQSGEVWLQIEFFPAGKLTIKTIKGRNLVNKDTFGRQDPYVVYECPGLSGTMKVKTKTDTDGGTNPHWDEDIELPIVDQYEVEMSVFDEDMVGANDLIGRAKFSLLPVFKSGFVDKWVKIKEKDKWGKVKDCGEIHLNITFFGPAGINM